MYKEDVLSLFRSNLRKEMTAVLSIAMSMVNVRYVYLQMLVTIDLISLTLNAK